ncbi:urotensin-2 isoform X2 [Vombatus ursinus]|uniref:urotensin-2 isoform X2 n=1 Tax=Vombatus ursinus TaxID=29139 RepID=UPI000FFD1A65|nr:urotensin-2 isoform X2 [Vombatus ursinus]
MSRRTSPPLQVTMYKLIFCCLFFACFLSPFLSLPVVDSRAVAYRLSDDEDAKLTLNDLYRASLLQMLPEIFGAERDQESRKADLSADIFDPQENVKKVFYGKDSKISLLSHLLARTRKQFKKRGTPSECFWKYCV